MPSYELDTGHDPRGGLAGLIRDLQRRIATLETQVRLRDATIDEPGVLQVRDAAGNVRFKVGREVVDGSIGVTFTRADGTDALRFRGFSNDPTFHEVLELFDRSGNVLYGDDEVTGQGISRPFVPMVAVGVADQADNVESTTATTFTDLFRMTFPKQHPKAEVTLALFTDVAATSGQVDLLDVVTGTRVAGPFSFTGGGIGTVLTGSVSGAHMTSKTLAVRGRVTSASGSVGALVLAAYGRG